MAGGTGGHIFPALAVAQLLSQHSVEVFWLGSQIGLESKLVAPHFPIEYLSISGLRGKGIATKLLAPWRMLRATWQALRIMYRIKPDLVLGMGGFVTGPGGLAAWLLRKSLIIHEQNSVAGYTNRILARFAKEVFQAFPDAFSKSIPVQTIGNPIRKEIASVISPGERYHNRQGALRVLVLGGSQGARPINQQMIQALRQLNSLKDIEIWHQTGSLDYEQMQQDYESINVSAKLSAFIDDMVDAYSWADVAICRAGALTVSEIAAVGLASVLIPLPHAVDNHQYYNALYLAQAGAATIILQRDLSAARLNAILKESIQNRAMLYEMAEKARSIANPGATEMVVRACMRLMKTA